MNVNVTPQIRAVGAFDEYIKPLRPFLDDDALTEIVINRPCEVWCEGRGGWTRHEVAALDYDVLRAIARLAASYTRQDISEERPVLSTILPGGERCQIVIPPAVPQNTISITIRRPSGVTMELEYFDRAGLFEDVVIETGALSEIDQQLVALREQRRWSAFFDLAVRARKNIIISGATGSGKTTFSKGLIRRIPEYERIITIEDTHELEVPQPNHVRLYYSKDGQGLSKAGPKELLESCLRMRPDRILLQELRDGTAFFYLRNVNSGHPGSITTVHADSAALAFEQLTLLIKESEGGADLDRHDIRALLVMLVDIIVQMKKLPDGRRRVTEVYFDPARQLASATS
ncbi:P-type DNA transfer ATPase VirB11 [Bradyrhizobium brasilense]|uniref:P-type DNA transfer ATPase VirB11 n=1 Tax=Bradyrhizobium brasilense TaxID=1419277 RepID=UPI001E4953FA|nr:P-type DNA transfer ATPase VirB11 [Bradyrhizobium brasilense]MCC8977071.1 P-type DNA transfer ATPase VirB11 [Bradyrhizobium brasilense]